jgi:phage/plasmid-associated DNA primase
VKHLHKCHTLIKTNQFKRAIQREAGDLCYNELFEYARDMNPRLIAFSNGVYDLEADEFREGIPEDYITKFMPFEFDMLLSEDSESVKNVRQFLEQIFPNSRVRTYFLDQYCEVFTGGNIFKNVLFWIGAGDNGKSVLALFFEKMLGPYCIKLPTSFIMGSRGSSSGASPELTRTGGGVRLVFLQEPSNTEEINGGILKEYTGNDSFYARALYREGKEIVPMFKLAVIANNPPRLFNADQAVWNRVRVIPFQAKFTDDAPASYEEQVRQNHFKKDKDFPLRIDVLLLLLTCRLISS